MFINFNMIFFQVLFMSSAGSIFVLNHNYIYNFMKIIIETCFFREDRDDYITILYDNIMEGSILNIST